MAQNIELETIAMDMTVCVHLSLHDLMGQVSSQLIIAPVFRYVLLEKTAFISSSLKHVEIR